MIPNGVALPPDGTMARLMDQFDVVRAYYYAFNSADVAALVSAYDERCVLEQVLTERDESFVRGRDNARQQLESFFAQYEGGFDDGAYFRVRTIGGIGTGWGWVQADWTQQLRSRYSGEVIACRGYSHFLVEDGRIRRHRSVSKAVAARANIDVEVSQPSDRTYPTRPVVGIGAVILVSERERHTIEAENPLPHPAGVVLIKRRFEPLAGQWSLPGGALEVGETLEAGVAREIFEETGLVVGVGPVVDVFDRILLDEQQRVRHHFVLIDYLCRPTGGRLQHGSDVADAALADPAALDRFGLTAKAEAVIHRAIGMAAERRP